MGIVFVVVVGIVFVFVGVVEFGFVFAFNVRLLLWVKSGQTKLEGK